MKNEDSEYHIAIYNGLINDLKETKNNFWFTLYYSLLLQSCIFALYYRSTIDCNVYWVLALIVMIASMFLLDHNMRQLKYFRKRKERVLSKYFPKDQKFVFLTSNNNFLKRKRINYERSFYYIYQAILLVAGLLVSLNTGGNQILLKVIYHI